MDFTHRRGVDFDDHRHTTTDDDAAKLRHRMQYRVIYRFELRIVHRDAFTNSSRT